MIIDPDAILFYADHPVEFTIDIIRAEPDEDQAKILQSVQDNPLTTVRSGHGIGKSAVLSWLIIWFLCTRPFPKIPCTAPTKHQLYDILWAEVSKWIRNNPLLEKEIVWTHEKVYMAGYPEEWFAVPRTATKPDALQGFHAEHVLYILEEASGIDNKIFEPVLGALSTEGSKLVMMGNPTQLIGFFFDSHHSLRHLYNAMHIDGRDSKRVSKDFVQTIINMYGEDSDVFRVRVAGQFPKALPDSFIPMDWAETASKVFQDIEDPRRVDIGVDIARYGDDSSALVPILDRAQEHEPDIHHHNDLMTIAGHVVVMIKKYARRCINASIHVKFDCDGLGAGVYDRVYEQREEIIAEIEDERREKKIDAPPFVLELLECHFGGEGGTINEKDPIDFANSTGLMWGAVREALRTQTLRLWNNAQQISELSNRKYTINSNGKIELERKEAMKKRGIGSPDIADALALAMYDPNVSDWSLD